MQEQLWSGVRALRRYQARGRVQGRPGGEVPLHARNSGFQETKSTGSYAPLFVEFWSGRQGMGWDDLIAEYILEVFVEEKCWELRVGSL